jgi:hypothetical protein
MKKLFSPLFAFAIALMLSVSALALTPAQLVLLKADIAASADMNTLPVTTDGAYEVARLYTLAPAVAMPVWQTRCPVSDIYDAIDWTKYTPTDAAELTGIYTARALGIQIKQMNLTNMLQGRNELNAAKVNIRLGLRDAVIQIPSDTSGAMVAAGGASGVNVLTACTRGANRIEKLLVTASQGSDTTGSVTARVLGFEGVINYQDVIESRNY